VLDLEQSREGVVFKVLLQPLSNRNEIAGIHEDSLKVRVIPPPSKGKANQACIDCVSRALRLKRNEVEIVSGHKVRRKKLQARGITIEEFKRRLKIS